MDGMGSVLKYGSQLFTSYGITIFITVAGTFLGLLVMSMYAYSISRPGFKLSRFLSIFLLIPMLFNGGTLSGYIVFTSWYHLKDSLLLLILPLCVSTMNVIILRTYIATSIPGELMEAAKIDGAGDYRTFFQITLPLVLPSLAAVGFMMATAYWNEWQNALLYRCSVDQQQSSSSCPSSHGWQYSPSDGQNGYCARSYRSHYDSVSFLPEVLCQGFDCRFCEGLIHIGYLRVNPLVR